MALNKDTADKCAAAITLGEYVLNEVKDKAAEDAKKELKFKRSLWKYTGRRYW